MVRFPGFKCRYTPLQGFPDEIITDPCILQIEKSPEELKYTEGEKSPRINKTDGSTIINIGKANFSSIVTENPKAASQYGRSIVEQEEARQDGKTTRARDRTSAEILLNMDD